MIATAQHTRHAGDMVRMLALELWPFIRNTSLRNSIGDSYLFTGTVTVPMRPAALSRTTNLTTDGLESCGSVSS